MRRIDVRQTVSISALVLLCLSFAGCSRSKVFLDCNWDITGLNERRDGGLAKLDSDIPTGDNFLVYFYDYPFGGLGTWVDLVSEDDQGQGIVTTQYVTNDEVPLPGISVNVVERQWYGEHVVIFNETPGGLLDSCE